MSSLILMRHGQASFGAERYDILSGTGLEQADAVGRWLGARGQSLSAIWHGPRRRQADSARAVVKATATTVEPRLAESLDEFGEGEEVLAAAAVLYSRPMTGPDAPTRQEQLRCYDQAMVAWSQGIIDIPGRADFRTFRRVVKAWLDERVDDAVAPSGRCELAVSSAGVIAVALCEVLDLPDDRWISLVRVIYNASLTELVFSGGRCGLRSFNGIGHLPRELLSGI